MKQHAAGFLCGLLLLAGCGGSDSTPPETSALPQEVHTVPALMIEKTALIPFAELSGTLEAKLQSAVAAEASGTVAQLFAIEGDSIRAGEPLLAFSAQGNIAAVDLQNANTALQNAERSLELIRQQTLESEKSARLGIDQAQKNLENTKRTGSSTGDSVDAQVASAQSGVDLAFLGVQNAKKNQADLFKNLDQQEKNLKQDEVNIISSAITSFRSALQQTDDILGASKINERKNDQFEVYLGFRDRQTFIDSQRLFLTAWTEFIQLEQMYADDPAAVTSNDIAVLAEDIRDVLLKTDIMLQQSITGTNFGEAQLSGFRSAMTMNRNATEGIIQSITRIGQQLTDFNTTKPQKIESAEIAVRQANEQLIQAQKGLAQSKSGGNVSIVGSENQVSSAENALESARTQFQIVQKQNEIAIQQATASRDAARNAVDRAATQYAKLVIKAPVDGVVTKKFVDVGDTVSVGSPLFIISTTNLLTLRGDIPVDVLPSIQKGSAAKVSIDSFGEKEGFVSNIFPVADLITRRVTIEISVDNSGANIPANIFATAKISLPAEQDIIMVPFKSLASQQPPSVYIVETKQQDGKNIYQVIKRSIETGRKNEDMIEVTSGLAVGDIIVSEPVTGLQDGDIVLFQVTETSLTPAPNGESATPIPAGTSSSPAQGIPSPMASAAAEASVLSGIVTLKPKVDNK